MAIEPRGTELTAAGDVRIRRALLSVSDKRGLVDFARGLGDLGVEIISTGGTASELAGERIETRAVEDYTGFPEILGGRVKTLNPRIHAGILAVRSEETHVSTLNEHEIEPIDLVCVNLYPFERVSSRRGAEDREIVENIDIGGPALIRAAAKNFEIAAARTTASCRGAPARAWRPRRSPTPLVTTSVFRAGSASARRTSRPSTRAASRRCSTCPTERTRTSAPPTTRKSGPART